MKSGAGLRGARRDLRGPSPPVAGPFASVELTRDPYVLVVAAHSRSQPGRVPSRSARSWASRWSAFEAAVITLALKPICSHAGSNPSCSAQTTMR
jgi:hypothetical protein